MSVIMFPNRMKPKQAAEFLGVSEDTLAVWRCTKRYPLPYMKIGRKVFYRAEDLQSFMEARTVVMEGV